jgi:hypothetical protein
MVKDLGTGGAVYTLLLFAGFVLGLAGYLFGWVLFVVGAALLVYRVTAFKKQ